MMQSDAAPSSATAASATKAKWPPSDLGWGALSVLDNPASPVLVSKQSAAAASGAPDGRSPYQHGRMARRPGRAYARKYYSVFELDQSQVMRIVRSWRSSG